MLHFYSVTDNNIPLPEILGDLPSNITTLPNTQAVFKCRVHSKVPPSIKWLKRTGPIYDTNQNYIPIDDKNLRANSIQPLESAGEMEVSEGEYLSKLILNNVSEKDSGIYICVGYNLRGFRIREVFLNIITDKKDQTTDMRDLLLLFLIPVAFASLPLFIWGCYVCNRLRRENKSTENYEYKLEYEARTMVYRCHKKSNSTAQRGV